MLAFIDRRMSPDVVRAAEAVSEARWRRSGDREYARAIRAYNIAKSAWLDARAKILTIETINAATCPSTLAVIFLPDPEIPEPAEVSVRPRADVFDMLEIPLHKDGCLRCGGAIDYSPPRGHGVCPGCFGKESTG